MRRLNAGDLQKVAQALTAKHGIIVKIGGDKAFTNKKVIVLPDWPSQAETNSKVYDLYRYFIDHESGHIVGKTNGKMFVKAEQDHCPAVRSIVEVLEDVRCDQVMASFWEGCGLNIERGAVQVFRSNEERAKEKGAGYSLSFQLTLLLYAVCHKLPIPEGIDDRLIQPVMAEKDWLLNQMAKVRGTRSLIPVAVHMYEAVKDYIQPAPKKAPEPSKQQEQQPMDDEASDEPAQVEEVAGNAPPEYENLPQPDDEDEEYDDDPVDGEEDEQQQEDEEDEQDGPSQMQQAAADAIEDAVDEANTPEEPEPEPGELKYDDEAAEDDVLDDEDLDEDEDFQSDDDLEDEDEGSGVFGEDGEDGDEGGGEGDEEAGGIDPFDLDPDEDDPGSMGDQAAEMINRELAATKRGDPLAGLPKFRPGRDIEMPFLTHADSHELQSFKRIVKKCGGPIGQRLSQLLLAEDNKGWRGGQRRGRPDPRRLASLAIKTSDLVMRKRVIQEAPNTAAYLLIDGSGSMIIGRIATAVQVGAAFASVLEGSGHASKVSVFHDADIYRDERETFLHGEAMDEAEAREKENRKLDDDVKRALNLEANGAEVDAVILSVIKGWHQRVRPTMTHMAAASRRNMAAGSTPMARSLSVAAHDLLSRPEPRKALIIMCDGGPNDAGATMEAIKRAEMLGVEVVLIGILTDQVCLLHHRHAIVGDMSNLGGAMMDQLRMALQPGKAKH